MINIATVVFLGTELVGIDIDTYVTVAFDILCLLLKLNAVNFTNVLHHFDHPYPYVVIKI